jgi:L-rhamnose isomerase / sugar isomerase
MMMINSEILASTEHEQRKIHAERFAVLKGQLEQDGMDVEGLVRELMALEIEVPSWALGTGGTRFGRFPIGGEPGNLFQKIEDVALLKKLTASVSSISLHIPWDIPRDTNAILDLLKENELRIDSVNSNTFQDHGDPSVSYKFGSLCHTDAAVRRKAIDHNIEVIRYGESLNARILTVWLSDGSDFPGQHHFRRAYSRTLDSLSLIYEQLPAGWDMLIEYKPYEPHFYSMVIPDWGTSLALCQALGNSAKVLVDLGHHLPNTNIEQIVARLMMFGRLGGFHFNGSMYGDDDLTTGSIKPYQLFLIFQELNDGMKDRSIAPVVPAWMIDASHNIKDPLEDLMQSCLNIRTAYAKALLVFRAKLHDAQEANDVVMAEEVLQKAFQCDVRLLVREAMIRKGGSLDPIGAYRQLGVRKRLIASRGEGSVASGL